MLPSAFVSQVPEKVSLVIPDAPQGAIRNPETQRKSM